MTKGGETPRVKRKASQEQTGSRKKHEAGKQLLFGGEGKQRLNITNQETTKVEDKVRASGTSVGTAARGKRVGIESGSTGVTAIGNSQYGIADGIPVKLKRKGQGQADGTAVGDSRHGVADGTAGDMRVEAKPKIQGQAEGTAVGGKTVMSGSPRDA